MKKTMGMMIAELRKAKGMTQLELAERMGVTDKAVSKWERDLSCPDINSLPTLAEALGTSVDALMQVKRAEEGPAHTPAEIVRVVLKALTLAMGVAVAVLSVMDLLDTKGAFTMLGIGLACAGMVLLGEKNGRDRRPGEVRLLRAPCLFPGRLVYWTKRGACCPEGRDGHGDQTIPPGGCRGDRPDGGRHHPPLQQQRLPTRLHRGQRGLPHPGGPAPPGGGGA